MSNSVRPHRWQLTRLPRPWDSPGKNTGVRCHFLLQCMKVKSESEVAQSCLTLSKLMDCRLPGSSVHGIFQARVLEWGAIAFSERMQYPVGFRLLSELEASATPGGLLQKEIRDPPQSYRIRCFGSGTQQCICLTSPPDDSEAC